MQIRQKMAPEEPRMDTKWIQNREKGVHLTKMAQDGAHERSGSMMVTSLGGFLGPLGVPKIDQKSILGPKRGARNRFFIDCSREQRFYNFRA